MEAGSDAKPNDDGVQIAGAHVVPDIQIFEFKGICMIVGVRCRQKKPRL
jgi:hypothetical protein